MFKGSSVGLVMVALALSACSGEIGAVPTGTNSDPGTNPDREPEPDPGPGTNPDAEPDPTLAADDGWRSVGVSEPAFDTLEFELQARVEVAKIDALVAIGPGEIADFSDASIKVRFADDGFIDVRDGSGYDSDAAFAYEPGVWYQIAISADVQAQTYDVQVGTDEGSLRTLIENAAFDSRTAVSDRLAAWAAWSSQNARLDVAGHSWVASGRCAPATCLSLGAECGQYGDGCEATLNCGGCGTGEACSSGVCVDTSTPAPPACEPESCMSLGVECGGASNGCGGTLSCGGCGSGQTCSEGVCVDVPPPSPPACEPESCMSLGVECGSASNGCGGTLSCGGCGSGQTCSEGACIDVPEPPPPSCEPESCMSLGVECGSANNGCGGTLSCGSCGSGQECSSGVCVDEPPSIPPPGSGGDPDQPWAHNTGPTNRDILRPIPRTNITVDGTVLENFSINGDLQISADNVTVRNCHIDCGSGVTGGPYCVVVEGGVKNFLIEDCEIEGATSAPVFSKSSITARRLHVHDSGADGFKIEGGGPSLIESSFVEKMGMISDSHADGVQTRGGRNITFRYNNIWMPHPGTPNFPGAPYKSNAAFILQLGTSNFTIDQNWLNGGSYTIYCLSTGTVHVTNNRFGRENARWEDGREGSRVRSGDCTTWQGNVWDDTGEPL